MSLKKNILANYISQIYVTLIGIVMVPQFIHYMGIEAYGLVGFFSMLQVWFQLLDMGLTPTLSRETARFNGCVADALPLWSLLRAMEGIFLLFGIIGCFTIVAASTSISTNWLKVENLELAEVKQSIIFIAVIVSLRWISGLYRGVISGFERLVWLGGFNAAISTARFVLVVPVFIYVGTNPSVFFGYQLVVAFFEVLLLAIYAYSLMPKVATTKSIDWSWKPLKRTFKFSVGIAFTSSIWIFATQADKMILSKILTLSEYAGFTLAVLISSFVVFVSSPISAAAIPRLNKLSGASNSEDFFSFYRNTTQLISVIALPVAAILVFFPFEVFLAWTGDEALSVKAAGILSSYAAGYGFLILSSMAAHLQVAKGDLRLHVIGSFIYIVVLVFLLTTFVKLYGADGAGYAWLAVNAAYFFLWIPLIHYRFLAGTYMLWLTNDVGKIAVAVFALGFLISKIHCIPDARIQAGFALVFIGIFLTVTAVFSSSTARMQISRILLSIRLKP